MDTKTSIPFVQYHCDCSSLNSVNQEQKRTSKNAELADDGKSSSNLSLSSLSQRHSPSNLELPDLPDGNSAIDTGRLLLSRDASAYLYPLSRLYFCEDCHEIRCPCCVQDEILSYYCPNCLFEVPTASVKSEQNRCARNCFQCPICCNTLAVMASQEITSVSSSAPNSSTYFLACNVCRWNSQEIGMVFEKPTSLASQLQKNEKTLPDVQEFEHLKEHFDKHLRPNTAPPLSSLLSFASSGTFNKFIGGGGGGRNNIYSELHHSASELHHQQVQGKLDDITTYEASVQVLSKDAMAQESLIGLRDMGRISTLVQRFTQLHDQPYQVDQLYPQRIHLCVKRSKRCRTCRHILIKPEQKAQTTRFKIKLVAMNYIPTITIINIATSSEAQQQQPLILKPGVATEFALKFTNPLYEEINVNLATPQLVGRTPSSGSTFDDTPPSAVNGCVTILSPHFTVNAYNETIEYDDEMDPLGGHDPSKKSKITSVSWTTGIYEKRSNSTSVIIEAIPKNSGEFKFPLLVTCNYRSDEDRMDISSGDIDQDEIDNIDMDNSLNGSRKANSSIRMDDEKTKHYSFWCLVDLGEVCA